MGQERDGKDPSSFTRTAWEVTGDPLPDNKQEFLVQLGSVRGETNEPGVYERWLEPASQNTAELEGILRDDIWTGFISYPVSKQVNSTRNNYPSCVEPYVA